MAASEASFTLLIWLNEIVPFYSLVQIAGSHLIQFALPTNLIYYHRLIIVQVPEMLGRRHHVRRPESCTAAPFSPSHSAGV